MPRRFPNQVHITVSRLLRTGYIKEPPAWHKAVMQYPPLPTPPRATPNRTPFDSISSTSHTRKAQHASAAKHDKWRRPEPEDIVYLEDQVRRQFYKDHPFEAFRAKSLVETDVELQRLKQLTGKGWDRLMQQTRNPTPEDVIRFTMSLHEHHGMALSHAYKTAIMQYRALRSELQITKAFAAREAEYYGAQFGPTELELGFQQEAKAIETWLPASQTTERHASKLPWQAEWKMPGLPPPEERWTRGQDYAERVAQGIRPNYAPELIVDAPVLVGSKAAEVELTIDAPAEDDLDRRSHSPKQSSKPKKR